MSDLIQNQKPAWVFICNPEKWDIQSYLRDLKDGKVSAKNTFAVKDHLALFQPNQYGLIKVGADHRSRVQMSKIAVQTNRSDYQKLDRGIYALVKILSVVNIADPNDSRFVNDPYILDQTSTYISNEKYVDIEYLYNAIDTPFVFASDTVDPEFEEYLNKVSQHQASNCLVSHEFIVHIVGKFLK